MALEKKGKYYYGGEANDLIAELYRYSKLNKYHIDSTEKIVCQVCGNDLFKLFTDNDETAAVVQCTNCSGRRFIRDSQKYLGENTENFECLCGNEDFQIITGISFYKGTADVRWVYVGGYCPKCGLVGIYVDWNER